MERHGEDTLKISCLRRVNSFLRMHVIVLFTRASCQAVSCHLWFPCLLRLTTPSGPARAWDFVAKEVADPESNSITVVDGDEIKPDEEGSVE
jgi:hypothetical protein